MKKINDYSAQFKIMSPKKPSQNSNTQSTHQSCPSVQRASGAFSKQAKATKKTLTKQNQEFINNISASGFKQFFS